MSLAGGARLGEPSSLVEPLSGNSLIPNKLQNEEATWSTAGEDSPPTSISEGGNDHHGTQQREELRRRTTRSEVNELL